MSYVELALFMWFMGNSLTSLTVSDSPWSPQHNTR